MKNQSLPQAQTSSLHPTTHGTIMAGLVAAVRNNRYGVGVAWGARVAGIVSFNRDHTRPIAESLLHRNDVNDIYSLSYGEEPKYMQHSRHVPSILQRGAEEGRGGKGSLFVVAAGNYGQSCALDAYVSSIHTIAVGAIGKGLVGADYSDSCDAVMISSYSSTTLREKGVVS